MSWVPLPEREVTFYIVGGDTGNAETCTLVTNAVRQVALVIDALANRVQSGERGETFGRLDLVARDDDFFVYAACTPGQAEGGISAKLTSNVLQFWVKRQAAAMPPASPATKGKP